jgi:tRNA threonylcarbamoyladenosine biosynthesis protein TsaE
MNSNRQNSNLQITSHSPDETMQIGGKIAAALKGGEVIALIGPLGSGKTHLVKGIAAGLGAADSKLVTSPTFVLVNEYTGTKIRLDTYHVDAYRLESVGEFEMLGFDDLCRPDSVVLIEWADKVKSALQNIDTIGVELSHIDKNKRRIRLKNAPDYIIESLR